MSILLLVQYFYLYLQLSWKIRLCAFISLYYTLNKQNFWYKCGICDKINLRNQKGKKIWDKIIEKRLNKSTCGPH